MLPDHAGVSTLPEDHAVQVEEEGLGRGESTFCAGLAGARSQLRAKPPGPLISGTPGRSRPLRPPLPLRWGGGCTQNLLEARAALGSMT